MSDALESSDVSSPVSRGPSPDHGFVLVDDGHSSDQEGAETGALAKDLAASKPGEEPELGGSTVSSRAPSPGPAGSLPAWLLRGAEGLRTNSRAGSADLGPQSATPGNPARLAQENQQLRGQLLELAQQQEWALGSVVASKDREIAELASRLRRVSNSFDRRSLDLATFHHDLQRSESGNHPQIVPVSFARLPSMLTSKTAAAGVSPSIKVALDAAGLPKYISLDWDSPQDENAPEGVPEEEEGDGEQAAHDQAGGAATPFAAQAQQDPTVQSPGTAGQGSGRARQGLDSAGQSLGKAGQGVLQAGHAVGRLPGRALSSGPGSFTRRVFCRAFGDLRAAAVNTKEAVGRAAGVPAHYGGKCVCQAKEAAGHASRTLHHPQVQEGLELALGLGLMLLAAHKTVRMARGAGARKHNRQSQHEAAPEAAETVLDSPELAALQERLQDALDHAFNHTDKWMAELGSLEDGELGPSEPAQAKEASQADGTGVEHTHEAAGRGPNQEGFPSVVSSIFPLELKWPEAPSLDMPSIEDMQGEQGQDGVRVLHLQGDSMRMPSFMRF